MHEIPLQRVAAIHDLSGFGRASLTVVIPILASMGVQTCPLPTAVLSSQTSGVEGFTFHDLTAEMGPMLDHWQRMGLSFDAVYSGFLGNPLQLEIAARCIGHFLKPGGFALVDPVLGDNGTLDPTQTPEMVEAMRQLIGHAHVITPNLHDLSGFGRASLTVVIPILASMGVQTCPLPTAVLSSQTSGVEGFTFHDLTAEMGPMLDHWQRMGLSFDAVYSGFLGNPLQLEIAARCIGHFLKPGGFALVDPVLGDNGTLDPTQTPEMVEAMRQLIGHAHVITPNLTEAAFLLDEPYRPDISPDGLKEQLRRLAAMGPDRVVITSAPATRPGHCAAVAYDREQGRFWKMESPYIPAFYPGTGDTFSSVLVGAFLQGDSLPVALERAVRFVTLGIRVTYGYDTRHSDGVLLERTLPALQDRCAIGEYEAF